MLENLIPAYRSNFQNHKYIRKYSQTYKMDKKIRLLALCAIISLATLACVLFLLGSLHRFPFLATILCSFIASEWSRAVHYRQFIDKKKDHIDNVAQFLKEAIPDWDLSSDDLIEELIDRLSVYIDADHPLNNIKAAISIFARYIFIPIVSFVAVVYTANVKDVDFEVVFSLAFYFLVLFGSIFCFIYPAKDLFYPNYYAAIGLREDLRDIRLMRLARDNQHKQSKSPITEPC